MRLLLSDPRHAASCLRRGAALAPLQRVLSKLASHVYADQVYGYWGHDWFFIGTAPSGEVEEGLKYREILCIVPCGKSFRIGFGATPTSDWSWSASNGQAHEVGMWQNCSEEEVVSLADEIITRDLNSLAENGTSQ